MLTLVGSWAVEAWRPGLLGRAPADIDLIGSLDEFNLIVRKLGGFKQVYPASERKMVALGRPGGPIIDFEIAWEGSTGRELCRLVQDDCGTTWKSKDKLGDIDLGLPYNVPSLDVLYALKSSQRFLKDSPHFLKTMRDRQKLATEGCSIPEAYQAWYKARERETYSYKHPNLNQGKMGFFSGDGVNYVYDHDSIHEAVKLGDRPAYSLFQKDGAQVAVDRQKFDALAEEQKLASVLEETYVLALERSQIPYPQTDPRKSFEKALEKVCTSITSGWWRDYAYEHYDAARAGYDPGYVQKFWAAVKTGIVKPFAGKAMEAA